MKTSQKLALLLTAAGALSPVGAFSQMTYNWNVAGDGVFTVPTNWNPNGVPGGADTAIIDDVVGGPHSQTVTYDISAGTLNAPITLGTLNLLNSAGATFSDVLNLTSTATQGASSTSTNPQGYFTISSAITLGAAAGTVELRLTPTVASGQLTLQDNAGITVNSGGLLTLNTTTTTNPTNAVIRANTTISGGTLSVLGASSVSGFGSAVTQRNTLTLNSGNITFGNTSGRLVSYGDFTATGGTITGSSANIFELYGVTNSVNDVTYVNPAAITYNLRNNAAGSSESLSSNVALPNIIARNGLINTITSTSPGQTVASLSITTTASTIKLGSNLNTPAVPVISVVGSAVDLAGFALTSTAATGSFTPVASTATTATTPLTTTISSSQGTGVLSVPAFTFGTNAALVPVSVGANVTIATTASPTGAANITSTVGTATFDPTSTLTFTGNSTSVINNRIIIASSGAGSTIGNLVVGTGASTTFLQQGNAPLNTQGNMTVFNGSTFDVNGRATTVAGKLQGNGLLVNASQGAGGLLTFSGSGGLSPGLGGANTGSGTVGTLTLGSPTTPIVLAATPLTLIGTSVSVFDLASDTSFDRLAANAAVVTVNGALSVNLLGGYSPAPGTSWNIITGTSAASMGTFSTISDGNPADMYSFTFTGGIGTLTLVPEPSTWVLTAAGLLLFVVLARRGVFRGVEN